MKISGQHHTNFIEQKAYDALPFTDDEIDLLISSGVLYVLKNNRFVFQIVGAAVMGKRVIYVLPKFEEETNQSARSGVFYVQAIKRYLLSGSRRPSTFPNLDNIPLVMRTFEELNSFYNQSGVYKERRHVHIASEVRQTNWIKTITKNRAMFSNIPDQPTPLQSVLYTNPLVATHNSYEGEVSNLFRNVLTLLSTFISPIIRINHPLESKASIDKIVDSVNGIFNKSVYYRRILRAHISAEAGPRKRVLKVLYNFLSSDNEGLAKIFGKRIFVFGTQNFESVWEDACLNAVNAQRGSKDLAQPRVSSGSVDIGLQRTDGIIYPSNESDKVTIVDAKYYIPYQGRPISLPVGDIMKQFGYAVSARATWERQAIQNFMMLPDAPDASERLSFLGTVDLEKNNLSVKDLDPIILIKVKPSEVFDFYNRREVNTWLKDQIVNREGIVKSLGLKRVLSADLNGGVSELEIDNNGAIVIKAGSVFKISQSLASKGPSKGANINSSWPYAKRLVKSMFDKKLLVQEPGSSQQNSSLRKLVSDVPCGSLEIATLVVSSLDVNVSSNIWVERGSRV